MASQMMLLDECLPVSALALGSLVESIRNPVMDAYVLPRPIPEDDILTVPAKNFEGLVSSSSGSSLRLALTRLFDVGHSTEDSSTETLKALRVVRHMLKQPKEVFRKMCNGDENARQWLNDGIQAGTRSYLVVEVQTAANPKITRGRTKSSSIDGAFTVPVSLIASGGTDILGLGSQLDTTAGASRSLSYGGSKSFETEGEAIFAVGYKKVTWKSWGFKKELDKAVLDKDITWSLLGQKRSREDHEEIVSVDLEDGVAGKRGNDEDDEEDGQDDDYLADLLKAGVEHDGQVYLVPEPEAAK